MGEICLNEKIVIGVTNRLNKKYIIDIILKYRGFTDNLYINSLNIESLNWIFKYFYNYLTFTDETNNINIPARIILYKGSSIGINDNYEVKGNDLHSGNVLLLNENKVVCGVLNLKKVDDKYFLTFNNQLLNENLKNIFYRNYSLGFLDLKDSQSIYDFYYNNKVLKPSRMNCKLAYISELVIIEPFKSNTSLIIDFGTSNTAVGAFIDSNYIPDLIKTSLIKNGVRLNGINKVKFFKEDLSTENYEIIPSIVSIKNCEDTSNIEYRFGYDALNNASKNNYNTIQSIFYGIKKWVNDYKKNEEVIDERGNIALIPRYEIIRAYFKYLIETAQNQHKCSYKSLHITSPVKQKQQFIQMYKEILNDYIIEENSALDEGISVLYNFISGQIEENNFNNAEEYKALIIDCGGGTTDLTSCKYFINDNSITYELDITTKYANGDTNFGGNNITFRIFQYLKIVFNDYYLYGKNTSLEDMFDIDILDMYRFIDNYSCELAYKNFVSLYENCEATIPTNFSKYRSSTTDIFAKVKSNFYFLWNLAEKIKIDFYKTNSIIQTNFYDDIETDLSDNKVKAKEKWRLNVYKSDNLSLVTEFPKVLITKYDISNLIRGDIYNVIKKFIQPIYEKGELHSFNFIKLTGQSCRIDIFRDALKEFIPGIIIQTSKKEKSLESYKLTCLEGAIKYQNAKNIGLIAPKILNNVPITPYKLIGYTHTGAQVVMMSSLEQITRTYGFISRNIETLYVELTLKNVDNKMLHKYVIQTNVNEFYQTSYDEIHSDYKSKIYQDDIDNIVDNEIKIFTYALEDKWGFYVVAICRRQGVLYKCNDRYLSFENDGWEVTFFNGV